MPLKFPLTNLKIPLPTPPRLLKNLPLMPSDKNADLTSSCLTYSCLLGNFLPRVFKIILVFLAALAALYLTLVEITSRNREITSRNREITSRNR